MRYRSTQRAIRRGHLVWVRNTLIECLDLFRVTRYGREYYGITVPCPNNYQVEPQHEPKMGFWARVIKFIKKLWR